MLSRKINTLLVLLISVFFFSCLKETNDNLDQLEKFYLNNPQVTAQVKFIHAYTPLTLGGAPAQSTSAVGFRITMDGNKVNAATNTSSSTNTLMYGGQPGATNYTASFFPTTTAYSFMQPGLHNFRFVMNRVTAGNFAPVTGDEIFNTNLTLNSGKKYSIFIADPYPAPNAYMVEDNFQEPNRGVYAVRFINLCGDVSTRFDITSLKHGTKLFSNVGYKEMKDYIYLPVPASTDTLHLRLAGTNTIVAQVNGFTATTQRVYTLYARGKTGVTGRLPSLNFYTNR
jgi:hypothetical protein